MVDKLMADERVRDEILAMMVKDGRAYPHMVKMMARELLHLRSGGTSPDQDGARYRFFRGNCHRIHFEMQGGVEEQVLSRIGFWESTRPPFNAKCFDEAFDAAMQESQK